MEAFSFSLEVCLDKLQFKLIIVSGSGFTIRFTWLCSMFYFAFKTILLNKTILQINL